VATSTERSLQYRHRLNAEYVSTHFGSIRETSLAAVQRGFPYFRRNFLPHLPAGLGLQIADIGCGFGSLVYTLTAHGYSNAVGVDASEEQVDLARRLGIAGIRRAEAHEYLLDNPSRFDVVFAVDLLEHLVKQEVVELIAAVARVLRPGGRFVVQTVNGESPFAGSIRYGDFTHELAFTKKSIAQVLRLA